MDTVQRMIGLGICRGGPADILMSSRQQFELINELEIDLKADKSTECKCVIAPNNGRHVFKSPVMGYSTNPNLGGISLQVGVFTLLQFRKLVPLVPVFNESRPDRLGLGLYSLSEDHFDLEALARLYRVEQVHADFISMPDAKKASQQAFLEEFERKKAVTRKASSMGIDPAAGLDDSESGFVVEEVYDENLFKQFSNTLVSQCLRFQDDPDFDPWTGTMDA